MRFITFIIIEHGLNFEMLKSKLQNLRIVHVWLVNGYFMNPETYFSAFETKSLLSPGDEKTRNTNKDIAKDLRNTILASADCQSIKNYWTEPMKE